MMFWHMLPGPVIGGQAYRIPPMTSAAWGERKVLFDEKTGRRWPDAELRERERERERERQIHEGIRILAVAEGRRPGRGKLGGIQIRGMHVDIYKSCHLR